MAVMANTTIAQRLYNSYGDRVERRECCKLDRPLGHRTQPWFSPASESSHPLRCRAKRASTPDRDVDYESCVVSDSPNLRQDPLEAILVIFGRRALIFLFESSWKKIKNDTTFVRMHSGDHLGDAKMSKKGTSLRRI